MKSTQKEKPIQVVKYTKETQKFEITQEAREFFQQLDGDIGFVVVCGKYRTGKSFLLNKLLDAGGEGFKVDAATDSCTQGIWMYTKPIINPKTNLQIYFLDTEGSESIERTTNHDAKIFALAILMSSIFVFNSRGCIDETSISQLQLTTTLAKNIQVQDQNKESVNESQIKYFTPKFVWILRDYVLEMRDQQQRELTPKEYMENCLTDESQYIKQNEQSKKIRKSLLNFFKERHCFPLITPVDDTQLKNVDQLALNQLRPEFQKTLMKLKEYLINNCSPKQIHSENVNGRMFCAMLDNYISVINRGGVPNIDTAWDSILKNECAQGYEQAKKNYSNNYTNFFIQNKNTRKLEETFQVLSQIRSECFDTFHLIAGVREMNKHYEDYKQKLIDLMNKTESEILNQNDEIHQSKNQEIIAQETKKVQDDVEKENYTYDDLHFFSSDFVGFILNYDKQASGVRKASTLYDYLKLTHSNLLKKLEKSIRQKQNKKGGTQTNINQELAQEIRDYDSQYKLLEQNITQQDTQLKKLEVEKQKLDEEKKKLKDELEKLQISNKQQGPSQINNAEKQKLDDDIKKQEKDKQELSLRLKNLTKKKKGCCG
ncbi:unnamed protein product (macronuclear) [Paramecium tetraurelia]|uniref:GB1/RHD3-type G domain-containing protein n=1 Tax=Paramecium tetraurelia TaxID=5888 RepID=A0DQT8_PARTE|nr:uncharacterized protein GSPATT00002805001 [Paramecium tetraurelia]CAK85405.1 unnamed protein product [Paramecium tetraurelia]|eukprot:XP_001452802.1 hypothetical protein (macronuclear) [Paramecium tetraurelia strain d4-2]